MTGAAGSPVLSVWLPFVLPAPNRRERMHWAEKRRRLADLAWQIRALGGVPPRAPVERSVVLVRRAALRELDVDALAGAAKWVLDVLQPASDRHPYGLGWISDDRPSVCRLIPEFERVRNKLAVGTRVVVWEAHGWATAMDQGQF